MSKLPQKKHSQIHRSSRPYLVINQVMNYLSRTNFCCFEFFFSCSGLTHRGNWFFSCHFQSPSRRSLAVQIFLSIQGARSISRVLWDTRLNLLQLLSGVMIGRCVFRDIPQSFFFCAVWRLPLFDNFGPFVIFLIIYLFLPAFFARSIEYSSFIQLYTIFIVFVLIFSLFYRFSCCFQLITGFPRFILFSAFFCQFFFHFFLFFSIVLLWLLFSIFRFSLFFSRF